MSLKEFIQPTSWEPVNMDHARGYQCLTATGEASRTAADCDVQASAYSSYCVSVSGGQCAMSLADAEKHCGAIEECAGVFCAPWYSDAERCIARSASELASTIIQNGPGVYNLLKPVRIKTSTASLPPLPPLTV